MKEINFQLDIPLGPEWHNIELLRTSILNCLTTIFHNHEFCQTVGIVTGELLENAIKYGDWNGPRKTSFKLRVAGDDRSVQVQVSNPVMIEDTNALDALKTIEWIRTFPSVQEAYHARLREIAARSDASMSGLGLVRIAYEGNCTLDATLDNDVLRIGATSTPA